MDKRFRGLSDERLIVLAKAAGDTASYGELVRRHEPALRVFLRNLSREAEAVDDVSQNAMVQGFLNIQQFRGDASFQTWLFKIAYREYLKVISKRKAEGHLVDRLRSEQGEPEAQDRNAPMDLNAALSVIGETERAAILLCDAFGFSHTEAAETLETPLGTVKSHIRRGRVKMRVFLQEKDTQ